MNFLSLQYKTFGLDFSDLSLRIINLKKKGKRLDLASWKHLKIKSGIIQNGEVMDKDSLSFIIKDAVAKIEGEKIKTKYVVASLPEKKAFLQVIQVPVMEKEELKTAIPFEAENYIPLPIEDVYLDFQVLPFTSKADYFDVLIAAVPKNIVDSYVFCIKKAGFIPKALEVESQSIVRSLIKNHVSPFPILIIDFGRSTTSFIIFSDHSLRFTSSMSFSSQKLTEAISKDLKISIENAEKLKLKYGLEASKGNSKSKQAIKVMTPLLAGFLKQARKYINYYQTHAKGKIEKIFLSGQGINLKGLPDFISSELDISTEYANPWVNIIPGSFKKVPQLPFKESFGYTTALGLALRSFKEL